MTLKCTVDGTPASPAHIVSVCHHCGRPVCARHGVEIPSDDAFDGTNAESGIRVPVPAMHCKECADEHHRREAQRAARTQAAQVQAPVAAPPQRQPGQPWQQW